MTAHEIKRTRQRLLSWICSKYEFRDCQPMLHGYRRKLATFLTPDLVGIRNFLLRQRAGAWDFSRG